MSANLTVSISDPYRSVEISDVSTDTQPCYRVLLGEGDMEFAYVFSTPVGAMACAHEWMGPLGIPEWAAYGPLETVVGVTQ